MSNVAARGPRWWLGLGGAATVALYVPSLVANFGFYDDHTAFWWSSVDPGSYVERTISSGRPLHGLLVEAGFLLVNSIESFRWLRALAVVAILSCGGLLFWAGRQAHFSPPASMALALGAASMPAMYVLATWAIASWQLVALVAGLAAGLLSTHRARAALIAATGLLALSLCIYQPSGLAAAPVFSFIAVGRLPERPPWKRGISVAVAGSALYVLASAMATHLTDAGLSARASPPSSLSLKAEWFLTDALPRTLNPLAFEPNPATAALVGFVVFTGVWLDLADIERRRRLVALSCLAGCWLATCLPILVVAMNFPTNRSRLANQVMFVLLVGLAVRGLSTVIDRRLVAAAGGVLTVVAWSHAASRLDQYIVAPRVEERRLVEDALAAARDPDEVFYLVIPERHETLAPGQSLDEYGRLTTAEEKAARAMVWMMLDEHRPLRVIVVDDLPPDEPGVDLQAVIQSTASRR